MNRAARRSEKEKRIQAVIAFSLEKGRLPWSTEVEAIMGPFLGKDRKRRKASDLIDKLCDEQGLIDKLVEQGK